MTRAMPTTIGISTIIITISITNIQRYHQHHCGPLGILMYDPRDPPSLTLWDQRPREPPCRRLGCPPPNGIIVPVRPVRDPVATSPRFSLHVSPPRCSLWVRAVPMAAPTSPCRLSNGLTVPAPATPTSTAPCQRKHCRVSDNASRANTNIVTLPAQALPCQRQRQQSQHNYGYRASASSAVPATAPTKPRQLF